MTNQQQPPFQPQQPYQQQYPQQPQQPFGQAPFQQQPFPPQPPQKKSGAGKKVGLGCLGVVAVCVLIGIGSAAMSGGGEDGDATASTSEAKDAGQKAEKQSQADQFKAYVSKNGSPAEKKAVAHVTKVQGAGEQNDVLDAADIYTDYAGGLTGAHTGEGKLLASAFADWKDSENGLVTVYDKDGEILSNGNF
ncbi:hypothetical protein [Streptomyces sp. ODS28]|uniref:hypothetical protein n=1 Tax=Streptomyces sp. ODS28 TaxID=3136688 RepID=UPI0031ED2A2E